MDVRSEPSLGTVQAQIADLAKALDGIATRTRAVALKICGPYPTDPMASLQPRGLRFAEGFLDHAGDGLAAAQASLRQAEQAIDALERRAS